MRKIAQIVALACFALAFQGLSPSAQAAQPLAQLKIIDQTATGGQSLVQDVRWRRHHRRHWRCRWRRHCWRHHGRRHCRMRRHCGWYR